MSYQFLQIEKEGPIATVTLDRPDKMNALSTDLMEEIEQVADSFRADTETRVVIFTGNGKHFSAGADLTDPKRAAMVGEGLLVRQRQFDLGPRMIDRLFNIPQITIAAINGGALGGGACIVSALDFRIGAEDCFVAYPESNLGMSLSWGGLALCVRLVGPARAKRFVVLGNRENAQTMLDWGFLDEVVPPDQLLSRARKMAAEYAAQPPIAAQMIKKSVNAISSAMDRAIMHIDTDQLLLTALTDDYREGIAAFLQKREPEFKGK